MSMAFSPHISGLKKILFAFDLLKIQDQFFQLVCLIQRHKAHVRQHFLQATEIHGNSYLIFHNKILKR
jgi:hypothetical protein